MTRKEIFIKILSEVSGKTEAEISELLIMFRKSHPGGKWDDEIPEPEAQKLLKQLRSEAPGILAWLNKGARDSSRLGNNTIQ